MKREYVILKKDLQGVAPSPFFAPSAFESAVSAAPMRIETEELDKKALSSLRKDAEFVAVAPVMPIKLITPLKTQDTSDPAAGAITWGVKAVKADSSPYTGDGIVPCVLDTGIDQSHVAFQGVQLVQGDFTGEGNGDKHGHGTHCAGTIFGRDTNGMRIGIARGVKKAVIGKVLNAQGSGGTDGILNAINWALQQGANVISMSLGMDFPGYVKQLVDGGMPVEAATSKALEAYRANVLMFQTMAEEAKNRGIITSIASIMTAAAGNESKRPTYEISVAPPAVADGVMSVAAIEQKAGGFDVSFFSNTGALISGPGRDVVSAKLGGGLASMSGTSMATPHVAGVAVLWAEKLKKMGILQNVQLMAHVIGNASRDGFAANVDPLDIGAGLVTAPQT
jgi:subtilisin family serine protease